MMTAALEDRAAATRRNLRHPARRPPGRAATAIILIVALMASGILRQVATDRQAVLVNIRGTATARSTLGNMDSFALALLLGGLRGPLIMILWPAIENQKADHNLEDVDTMIEWVRLLQPEFDTVHIFQIWNKAYNLSAMMASPANKYQVIMEALDYAEKVDQEKPDDINILGSISNVYGGKLGSINLPEFGFYGRQFRQESLTDTNRLAVYPELAKHYSRLSKLAPILDADNQIRPDLLIPNRQRPADLAADAEWNDGSELQYLKTYGPFPYGMSPLAMSYNYAKRAEVCESAEGQKPLQLSAMVTDSQPPLQLKFWEEDDARHGRMYESRAFGIALNDSIQSEAELALVAPDAKPVDRSAVDAALYYYAISARVSRDAIVEYKRHLAKPEYSMRLPIYRSHIADMQAADAMNNADHDYLQAIISTDPAEHKRLLTSAQASYHKAMIRRMRTYLEFYTEDAALWAVGPQIPGGSVMPPTGSPDSMHAHDRDKERVFNLSEVSVPDVYAKAMTAARALNSSDHADERQTYGVSVDHCQVRLALIQKELKAP